MNLIHSYYYRRQVVDKRGHLFVYMILGNRGHLDLLLAYIGRSLLVWFSDMRNIFLGVAAPAWALIAL